MHSTPWAPHPTRLAGLLRTQQLITGEGGDVVSVLSQAIGEVAHDLGLSEPAEIKRALSVICLEMGFYGRFASPTIDRAVQPPARQHRIALSADRKKN